MCSAGARLSGHAARVAANNNLKSTSHEHCEQRGTCHSGSGPAPSAAVHHSAWWNENTAPPQPLPVSPWQPGDWWDDVIVNTHARTHTHPHTHTQTRGDGCLCDESWLEALPSFRKGPVSKDPHRLNPLTFIRECPFPSLPLPRSLSISSSSHHFGTKPRSHSLWEYQLRLDILLPQIPSLCTQPWMARLLNELEL